MITLDVITRTARLRTMDAEIAGAGMLPMNDGAELLDAARKLVTTIEDARARSRCARIGAKNLWPLRSGFAAAALLLALGCGGTPPAPAPEQVFIARPSHCVIEIRPADAPVITLDLREGEARKINIGDTEVEVAVVAPYRGGPEVAP